MPRNIIQNQRGVVQILPLFLILAGVAVILFLLLSSTASFQGNLFSSLFPKPASQAAVSDPIPPFPPLALRIDSGDVQSAYTDSAGNDWTRDQPYTVGGFGFVSGDAYTGSNVTGTPDSALYANSRFGSTFGYNFTVPNGHYRVNLKLAEIRTAACATGARVFNVQAEGINLVKGQDTFARVGCAKAGDVGLEVDVNDGVLNLNFISVAGLAAVNAVEVIRIP